MLQQLLRRSLWGGEEEEVDEESFTGPIKSIEDIRDQARAYYSDPTNSALYFMPPKSAVKFGGAFADGGLASIPRDGYRIDLVTFTKSRPDDESWCR